jgi:hypothetical protein
MIRTLAAALATRERARRADTEGATSATEENLP